jgi:endoglucanase
VQEEPVSGEHGAAASVHLVEPDMAIILECGLADDTPEHGGNGVIRLGGGPGLAIADDGMLLGSALREWVADTAEQAGIPLQPYVLKGGNTDGKAIQQHRGGVPTVSLTVPMRYAHCHSGIMKRADYDRTFKLLGLLIEKLNDTTVAAFTNWSKR